VCLRAISCLRLQDLPQHTPGLAGAETKIRLNPLRRVLSALLWKKDPAMKQNYQFEKRQREMEKKKKKAEKAQKKAGTTETPPPPVSS
jgi:hypothetical protein